MGTIGHELTKEQQEIIDYKGDELLVRGIAGSGKTLVMLRKARLTAEKYPKDKVAVFSYGRPLTRASKILLDQLVLENLEISTFHSWAMKVYRGLTGKKQLYMAERSKRDFLGAALEKMWGMDHRFIHEEKYRNFLKEEISWMKGMGIETLEEYLDANRRGRGNEVRVTKNDREIIFKIFKMYNKEKDFFLDYDDLGLEIWKRMDDIPEEFKYEHVFVDEAQDLHKIQLIVLRSIAKKTFFLSADKGQKIYKTSFSWKDIGLDITGGRTKILRRSFRSTKEIVQLAVSLQMNDSVTEDEEYTAPVIPESSGPVPDVFKLGSKDEQDMAVIQAIKSISKKGQDKTIGLLTRGKRATSSWKRKLSKQGINAELISEEGSNPFNPGVKISTFHSAKGLEFDVVIIPDLSDNFTEEQLENKNFMDHERRLLYVSITRAKSYLQIYFYGEMSPLLKEMDENCYNLHEF